MISPIIIKQDKKHVKDLEKFNPHRIISNEEFQANLTAIITYYEMTKGEYRRRFTSELSREDVLIA
jgi:hypothetical protein